MDSGGDGKQLDVMRWERQAVVSVLRWLAGAVVVIGAVLASNRDFDAVAIAVLLVGLAAVVAVGTYDRRARRNGRAGGL